MMDKIIRNDQDVIYKNGSGTIELYDAMYKGKSCYCMEHVPTGDKYIFSHEKMILDKVMERISNTGIVYEHGFQMKKKDDISMCSLPIFLYCVYDNTDPNSMRGARMQWNKTDGVNDLRRGSLVHLGGIVESRVDIVERPGHSGEKYMMVNAKNYHELSDYDPDLYNLLISGKYTGISYNRQWKRLAVTIFADNKAKDEHKPCKIARFSDLVFGCFSCYESTDEGYQQFINDYPELNRSYTGDGEYDCGHILPITWNNTRHNTMRMQRETNVNMTSYAAALYDGVFQMYAIAFPEDDAEIILAVISVFGHPRFYKFKSAEEYAAMQYELVGVTKDIALENGGKRRSVFRNINHIVVNSSEGLLDEQTPYQRYWDKKCIKEREEEREKIMTDPEMMLSRFWKWCDRRDALITAYKERPDLFMEYNSSDPNCVVMDLLGIRRFDLTAQSQKIDLGDGRKGVVIVTPVKVDNKG